MTNENQITTATMRNLVEAANGIDRINEAEMGLKPNLETRFKAAIAHMQTLEDLEAKMELSMRRLKEEMIKLEKANNSLLVPVLDTLRNNEILPKSISVEAQRRIKECQAACNEVRLASEMVGTHLSSMSNTWKKLN
jgi:DNA-directed RNA polymerase subunit F